MSKYSPHRREWLEMSNREAWRWLLALAGLMLAVALGCAAVGGAA